MDGIINARQATLGDGMKVKRILPFRQRRMVGLFNEKTRYFSRLLA